MLNFFSFFFQNMSFGFLLTDLFLTKAGPCTVLLYNSNLRIVTVCPQNEIQQLHSRLVSGFMRRVAPIRAEPTPNANITHNPSSQP